MRRPPHWNEVEHERAIAVYLPELYSDGSATLRLYADGGSAFAVTVAHGGLDVALPLLAATPPTRRQVCAKLSTTTDAAIFYVTIITAVDACVVVGCWGSVAAITGAARRRGERGRSSEVRADGVRV